ncbi:MAG: GldG family protein, partial [Acidobacteriota bacterium]
MNDPISDDRPARRAGAKALGDATVLTAGVALVIALVGMLNYLAFRHHVRFDWTASQLYTLSTLGRDAVVGVEEDVEVLVVLRPESELATAVEELLAQIRAANPRITWRALDLTRNPIEAQALVARYGVERENVVIVQRGDERRVINEFDLAEFDYGDGQLDQAPALRAFRGEGQIISAILAVTRAEAPRVVFTRGHGEADPFGANTDRGFAAATELLGRDNFRYDTVDTLAGDALDPDAIDLLVVAGPTTTFQPGELSAFDRYLQAGGRMLWLLDPALDLTATAFAARGPDEDLRAWLARYGVALGNDLVVDPVQRIIGFGPETLLADTYGDHPIVEPLRASGVPVLLPLARSVARAADGPTDPALASA